MPNYRIIQYGRYHDTFVSEFFLQLANVIEVSRGRSQHQQRFKEQSFSLLLGLAQSFGGTIGGVVGAVGDMGLSVLGQREENKKMGLLNPEYVSGQWGSLREMVNEAAREAVSRYRHYLTGCSEADATELGRVSVQRLWEYLSRTKQFFSIDTMLEGILRGKSGFLHDGLSDTKLEKPTDTAEGVLKHSGIAYDEQGKWQYALHPKDKDRYGFVLLPSEQAKARIIEKKYQLFAVSIERATELKALWEVPLGGDIAEDSSVIDAGYQARLNKLEQDWCDIETWQHIVNSKLEDLAQQGAQTQEAVASLQDVTTAHAMRLEFLERRYVSTATENTGWSYFAYPRDMSFQKRPQLWSTLEARFASAVSTPVVLSGLGGSGKTSLASEWAYAQEESNRYANVRWLSMDTTFKQFGSVEKWAEELGLPYQEKPLNELWAMIAKHLSAESWLIVFDNVPNYDDIKEGLAQFRLTSEQRILITTRDATGWCYPITVDVYSEEDAVSYIEQQMAAVEHKGFDITAAKNLAQHLGYHPLALELAMAQVCLDLWSLTAYQARLERQELALSQSASMQSQARLSTHQTIHALWQDSLPNLSEDALSMLCFLSFLDAQGGAQDLLLAFFEDDEMRLNQAVRLLRQKSLIKHVDLENGDDNIGAWSVHRLLQDAVRDKLVEDFAEESAKWEAFLNRNWEIVKKVFPYAIATAQDVSAIRRGVSHGHVFLKYMETIAKRWSSEVPKSFLLPWQAGILLKVGWGEQSLVQFDVAIEHLNQALIIYRQAFGESSSHPSIAAALNNLGSAYQAQGDTARAIKFYEESLAIRRIVYIGTPNDPDIASTLNNLGNAYCTQGDTARAIKLYDDSLAMYRIVYADTPNHSDITSTLNNLGSAYCTQGDTARAMKFYEESLAMKRIVYTGTPNHPDIARTLGNLGMTYKAQGDIARAIKLYEESLAMKRIVYTGTPNHPDIASALQNLGAVYQAQGDIARAIKFYEECLAMLRIVFASTPENPRIASTLNNLGSAYKAQGDIARAIKFCEDSLAMYRIVYVSTPNHPDIATTLNNLGSAYCTQGDTARAIKLYDDSLAIYRIVYANTPNHPDIANTLNNLGIAYDAQDDTARAIKFYEECLAMRRIVYVSTPNHPDIASALNNLGGVYYAQGDIARAIKFCEDSLAMYRIVYIGTPNHPDIASALNNLGGAYQAQGDIARAIKFCEDSLAMHRIVYASTPNHPDIATILNNLGSAYKVQGDTVRAIGFYEESLAMRRIIYASTPNHPSIASTLRNVTLAVSGVYLSQYLGSFFHARGSRKISELQNTLVANPKLSETQLVELVSQATINGRKSKEMLSKFYP